VCFLKRETFFLKIALFLIGAPILALCLFLVPNIANYAAELYPDMAYMKYLVLINMYAAAIPFYFALYQSYKLLRYIDRNDAFSALSVKALKTIKYCAVAISVLYIMGLPLFYLIAELDDAPGIILIILVIIAASAVIGIFAAVLQKLLGHAIDIKEENDLTV